MTSGPSRAGIVYLVGAGPGDPALLTRRGAELIARADAVVYDGLVAAALLDLARPGCERVYAGKKHAAGAAPLTQTEINALLVERARAGQRVVRLKGGDPFLFGRGAEECRALVEAGIPYEVVPGVSAANAVSAYAGIPLTARGITSTVAFATGHEAAGKPESDVDWQALARAGTVVLFMALRTAGECAERLVGAGRAPDTPAAAIYWGTTAAQRTVISTLAQLGEDVRAAGMKPPVLVIVGEVVDLRAELAWQERRPLFGLRVLVTRPAAQAARFAEALAELGAEPVLAPVTRIEPPDAEAGAAIAAALDRLGDADWVVFTSANAVRRFFEELAARRRDARALAGARIACVGTATAEALAAAGLLADVIPGRGDARRVAEAVIAASRGDVRGMHILIPRAAGGTGDAADRLRGAGAEVTAVSIYRTESTPAADPAIRRALDLLEGGAIDVATLFAPSQVRALFALLGDRAAEMLSRCRLVAAIGATTQRALESRGVRVGLVPSSPRAEILAEEIAAAVRQKPQES